MHNLRITFTHLHSFACIIKLIMGTFILYAWSGTDPIFCSNENCFFLNTSLRLDESFLFLLLHFFQLDFQSQICSWLFSNKSIFPKCFIPFIIILSVYFFHLLFIYSSYYSFNPPTESKAVSHLCVVYLFIYLIKEWCHFFIIVTFHRRSYILTCCYPHMTEKWQRASSRS